MSEAELLAAIGAAEGDGIRILSLLRQYRDAHRQEERERCEALLTKAKKRIDALEMQIEDEEAKWSDDFGF
jgi:hypothetical protein